MNKTNEITDSLKKAKKRAIACVDSFIDNNILLLICGIDYNQVTLWRFFIEEYQNRHGGDKYSIYTCDCLHCLILRGKFSMVNCENYSICNCSDCKKIEVSINQIRNAYK